MPYDQMPVALANKAADAALIIPPNVDVAVEKGFAVRWIDPDHAVKVLPILVGVDQMNTDWAAKNEKAAFAFVEAVLRGAHDYCEAYHRGANRAEVVRIMAKYIDITDPAIVDAIEWGARDPEGRIFPASLDDIQEFYLQQGLIARKYTNDELFDDRYGEAARKKVGPFKLQAKSEKPGCR
jgi:NitT/TauT family transport system substrate-binding protein